MRLNKTIALCLFLCVFASLRADSQVRPVNDYGALGLGHLLNRLNTTASVMMIGAHPDDEDSALLAYLARGENARTAYLSLTRGDGGQNIIGPELGEALGVIRTEELLQARRLDGAEQYFTRAYDYGFSKTLAEAKSKWPEDVIKCDVVRAIRLFRPMVVISRFTGTPADGHGHHQYAGYITPIAVKAAADPKQCTDAGEPPWQVLKFYVEQSFGDTSQPTLRINTGQYDPLLGRTYFEIAMEGRSFHRSQGEGRIGYRGDQFSGLNLVESTVPRVEIERSVFDSVDKSIAAIAKYSDRLRESDLKDLTCLQESATLALSKFDPLAPAKLLPILVDGYSCADRLKEIIEISSLSYEKLDEFRDAIKLAAGIQLDAMTDRETVSQFEEFPIAERAYSSSVGEITIIGPTFPPQWVNLGVDETKSSDRMGRQDNPRYAKTFRLHTSNAIEVSQPYWLEDPRRGDMYSWKSWQGLKGYEQLQKWYPQTLPFGPPLIGARFSVEVFGREITFTQPLEYRFADPVHGEIRREVNAVPALSVSVDRDLMIVPTSGKSQVKRLFVNVTNNTAKEQSGNASLNIATSPEWKVGTPLGSTFTLKTKGAKASIPFDITIPANTKAGAIPIRASAEVGQMRYALTMNVVSYPHIQTHRYYTPADATVEVLDLKTASVKVGYVMGSGDEVPDAIRQMGMDVTMLEEKDLASGDLSKYDTVVVGIRASETRPDMMANKQRLMDYAKNGGNLIVQYQRGNFAKSGLTPYPVDTDDKQGTTAGNVARVVDENAPVKILQPENAVFNFPNKITATDFEGWVQERNAYNLVTFDPQYTPLLESHDAGEQENKGGLVIAKYGNGTYVYCSYSFFRQLPAGVPGAYRLFANLLSLPKAK